MKFIEQGMDHCCFVYAVANFQIWKEKEIPDLEVAKDIGKCRDGGVINPRAVVEYFQADLKSTINYNEVFEKGGIINIKHPVWNGHSFFMFPIDDSSVVAVNSWLGPLVTRAYRDDFLQFVSTQFGSFWASNS